MTAFQEPVSLALICGGLAAYEFSDWHPALLPASFVMAFVGAALHPGLPEAVGSVLNIFMLHTASLGAGWSVTP